MVEYLERILERVDSIKLYQSSKDAMYYAEIHVGKQFSYEWSGSIEDLIMLVSEKLEK